MDYPKSVPGVGLVDGKFVDEDQVNGTTGSLIPAAWGNAVTDELLSILARSGVVPDEAQVNQLALAIFDSPTFGVGAKGATAAQFDSDLSLATTAFVQRALGNFSGQVAVAVTQSLTIADAGKIINASKTIALTLPVGVAGSVGATFQINNAGDGVVTVQAAGGNSLYGIGSGTPRTFVLGPGDCVTIAYVGGNAWYAWGGLQLGASAAFGSILAGNGFQKLPTGKIRQWGLSPVIASGASVVLTLPIAFPNAAHNCHVTLAGGIPNEQYTPSVQITTTTLAINHRASAGAPANYFWSVEGN